VPSVSSDRDDFLYGVFWDATQPFLTPVLENQCNSFLQVFETLFLGSPLAIGAGELWAKGDEPVFITFNDCCELIGHVDLPLAQIIMSSKREVFYPCPDPETTSG
jgi:hypothetical protein